MIPLHKYSYPYLGQLEFSSGAFMLLVGVTWLWVKVCVLIKGPTADNAYESKTKPWGQKNSL